MYFKNEEKLNQYLKKKRNPKKSNFYEKSLFEINKELAVKLFKEYILCKDENIELNHFVRLSKNKFILFCRRNKVDYFELITIKGFNISVIHLSDKLINLKNGKEDKRIKSFCNDFNLLEYL